MTKQVEAQHVSIHYPPEATDTEPIGAVDVTPELGGCAIRSQLNGYKEHLNYVSDRLPLYNFRAERALKSAIKALNVHADQIHSYEPQTAFYLQKSS